MELLPFVSIYTVFCIAFIEGCALGRAIDEISEINSILGITDPVSAITVPEIVDIREHVHFQLHTRRTSNDGVLFTLDPSAFEKSTFDVDQPVKIMVHGFLGRLRDGWMTTAKDAMLTREDVNVILVGWTEITQVLLYPWVVQQSFLVAQYLGELVDFLVEHGIPSDHIHMIGHSIGAHIAGVASKEAMSGIVGRITGLDAAWPLYKGLREFDRLDATDADFVDCIHTSSGLLGIPHPFCDADFYPNGGTLYQPGCNALNLVICSHRRSHDFFTESLDSNLRFKAYTCSPSLLTLLDCTDEGALMGYPSSPKHKGVFYVPTGDHPPYSVTHDTRLDVLRRTLMRSLLHL
ncbi:hypothetical protein GE061_014128 [Apolygus lucorum]|uniref:Lipase domain-containing protein n=1 Tax=Apolygus lucorum TaxID=248454 RepID=A0A8S9XTU1_APOLU|nr:hypothetical protein GE061_014128 [Apolygus lucorum]